MSELSLAEAGLSPSEIAAIPLRRTWYGIVGSKGDALDPQRCTQDHEEAKARAVCANKDWPCQGPWHVIVLTENLRAPA